NLYIADGDHTGQVITSTTGSISVWIDGDGSYNCTDGSGGPYADLNMSISCAPAPSCLAPTDLVTSLITATSADFSWTSGGTETDYEYIVQDDGTGEPTGSGIVVTGATSVTSNNLTAETNYEVYVRSNCDTNGFSTWLGPVTFTTEPTPIVPDYTNNFSMYPGLNWSEGTGETTPSGTYSGWVSDGFGNVGTSGSARVEIYSTGGDEWLVTPAFDLSSGGYEINLDVALTDYYNTDADVIGSDDAVYLMQSLDNGVNWTAIYTWDSTSSISNTGDNITVDISSLTSATTKFALFMLEGSTSGGDVSFYVDNFAVRTPPSCFAPAANSMAASLITATSADLSWTAGATETAWNLEYGATGFTPGAGTTVAVTANTYALMGLTANTSYDFYIQADCGGNGTSAWVGPFTFTTLCDAVTTFPWTEDFEGITVPSLPSCWSENNNNADTDFWKTYDEYGTSDSYSVGMYTDYNSGANDDYLILPQFVLTGNERLKFSVRSRSSGEPNDYKVVLSTSSNDPTDFTTDLMALTVATATHTEQVIDLSAYSGNVYIAIHVPADGLDGYYLYVDDFTVEAIPSCIAVTDLAASNLTTTSADLSWTAGATETAWNLEYGATGFVQGAGTTVAVTANSYALTGLAANTSYDVYVQADCGAGDTSTWVGPITIFTGYCVPSSSSSLTFIDSVTSTGAFSDLNNGADGYSETGYANYFSTDAIQSLAGGSFDLTATIIGGTAGFAVWIDYNNDLTFDSTEVVFNTTSYANGPFTATIALPETLADGDYRMRLMVDYSDSNPNDNACAFNGTRAEAEDYKITIDSSLGIDTVSKSNFTYFPNPVNNVLSIKAQASIDSITVYNMLGQTVVRSTPNTTTTTVDMSGLQTGAYFVQVAINNSIETVRVIKN
ncbi:choice-of-anchor J domain-containing protein, partial [Flavobacteriaceae bacterium]|nr:choice-of-anchor J domain-containing protein [Flavobacteriaceae bacterium]